MALGPGELRPRLAPNPPKGRVLPHRLRWRLLPRRRSCCCTRSPGRGVREAAVAGGRGTLGERRRPPRGGTRRRAGGLSAAAAADPVADTKGLSRAPDLGGFV